MNFDKINSSKRIPIIGFEGLNSTGKTTQIDLLRNNLNKLKIHSKVLKGNGSRKGEGLIETDPVSSWWRENYGKIMEADINSEEGLKMAEMAANRLNREIYVETKRALPSYMKQHDLDTAIVIMDRSVVSSLFVLKRYKDSVTMDDLKKFRQGKGLVTKELEFPELIFLFNAPKEVLLERNKSRKDGDKKIQFNEKIIINKYDEFQQHIASLPKEIKERTIIIDASKPADVIQNEILNDVIRLIDNS